MTQVRTTMQPDQVIEVGDAELLDLKRQGLLVGEPEPAQVSAPAATPSAVPGALDKKTSTAKSS